MRATRQKMLSIALAALVLPIGSADKHDGWATSQVYSSFGKWTMPAKDAATADEVRCMVALRRSCGGHATQGDAGSRFPSLCFYRALP